MLTLALNVEQGEAVRLRGGGEEEIIKKREKPQRLFSRCKVNAVPR